MQRGFPILSLPIVAFFLGKNVFGVYALIISLSGMFSYALVCNVTAWVYREGYSCSKSAWQQIVKFNIYSGFITFIVFSIMLAFHSHSLTLFVLILSCSEGLFNSVLSLMRVVNKEKSYFLIILLRTSFLLVFIVLWSSVFSAKLYDVIIGQFIITLILSLLIMMREGRRHALTNAKIQTNVYQVLSYSLPLLLHSMFQFLISSVDRIILKSLSTNQVLSEYTFVYSIASIVLLFSAVFSMIFPEYIIKNYNHWLQSNTRRRLLLISNISIVFLIALVLVICKVVFLIPAFKQYNFPHSYAVLFLISLSFVFMFRYYLYENILSYLRKTNQIAVITFITGLINIPLSYFFIYRYGILGAAYSSFLIMYIYAMLIGLGATLYEKKLRCLIWQEGTDITILFSGVTIYFFYRLT